MSRRKRSKRFNGCRGKAAFGTREEANGVHPKQLAYPCPWCRCWHLTSAEERETREPSPEVVPASVARHAVDCICDACWNHAHGVAP